MQNSPIIVTIGGYGRSGSTLLELLLVRRVRAISVGELKYLWFRGFIRGELCACGKPVNKCDFWAAVIKRAFPRGEPDFERIETLRLSVERHRLHFAHRMLGIPSARYERRRIEYVGIIRALMKAISDVSGEYVIIDGSKDPAHVDLMLEAFPDTVKPIHLVRDSRAVAYSFQNPKVRREVYWQTELMGKNSYLIASMHWNFINWALDKLFSAQEARLVRYEDLAEEHEATVTDLAEWIDGPVAVPERMAPSHSVSGNPMRFDQEVEVRPDGRWVKGQSWIKSALVTAATFGGLSRYGYLTRQTTSRTSR